MWCDRCERISFEKHWRSHHRENKEFVKFPYTLLQGWNLSLAGTWQQVQSHSKIAGALDSIAEDQLQEGETVWEAESTANKMQELVCVHVDPMDWNSAALLLHKTSTPRRRIGLANMCRPLPVISRALAHFEERSQKIWRHIKRQSSWYWLQRSPVLQANQEKNANDGNAPETALNLRDKLCVYWPHYIWHTWS